MATPLVLAHSGSTTTPRPLRWALGSSRRQAFVRLVDDSGRHDTAPDIQFYSMEHPLRGIRYDAESARRN